MENPQLHNQCTLSQEQQAQGTWNRYSTAGGGPTLLVDQRAKLGISRHAGRGTMTVACRACGVPLCVFVAVFVFSPSNIVVELPVHACVVTNRPIPLKWRLTAPRTLMF